MALGKKIILLLLLLVGLITYTVYTFDYKTILSSQTIEGEENKSSMFSEYSTDIMNKFDEAKVFVMDKYKELKGEEAQLSNESVSLELIKEDGVILMNGIFTNEKQAQEIADLLNINRDGDYKYNANIAKDDVLINKLSSLIAPLKNFFVDGAKLTLNNGRVSLEGKLGDANYLDLVNSIIARSGIDVQRDIIKPEISKTQKIINSMQNIVKEEEQIEEEVEFTDKKSKEVFAKKDEAKKTNEVSKKEPEVKKEENSTDSKLSVKAQEVQKEINDVLAKKKIVFKRRSTKITFDSIPTVKQIVKILKDNPNIKIEIAGHTDSRGKASLNKRISQDRANSVKKVLASMGISKKRLKAVGYGEDFPIAKDDDQGLSEINRRVEFNIIGE